MNEAKIRQLKSEIEAKTAQLDKLKAELDKAMTSEPSINDRWKPFFYTPYFFIDEFGATRVNEWNARNGDITRNCFYNCWETEEKAKEVAEKVKLLFLIEQIHDILCPDYKPDWRDSKKIKYRVQYSVDNHCWYASSSYSYCVTFTHFDTEKHAEQAANILNDMGVKSV